MDTGNKEKTNSLRNDLIASVRKLINKYEEKHCVGDGGRLFHLPQSREKIGFYVLPRVF